MVNVVKTIPRCSNELLARYQDQASATVHEAMGRRNAMAPEIKPIERAMRFAGRALTVRCHTGDNLMLIKAISMARKGDVIVADMGNAVANGPFGEVLAVECVTKGLAGLILNCAVRDSQEIIRLGLPVFSAQICISGTAKATLGTINHPVSCGGVIVNPGDVVVADADGVVVVPLDEAEDVLNAANSRTAKEAEVMKRLYAGESLFDIYEYQKILDSLHCTEE